MDEQPTHYNTEDHTHETDTERVSGAMIKLLAIFGMIAILGLAAWLSVQIIRYAPSVVATVSNIDLTSLPIGSNSENTAEVPSELTFVLSTTTYDSGTPFALAWNTQTEGYQDYLFSYTCADGFDMRVMEGPTFEDIPCDTEYSFTTQSNELLLMPVSSQNRYLDVTLSLDSAASGAQQGDQMTFTFVNSDLSSSPSITDEEVTDESDTETPSQNNTTDNTTPSSNTTTGTGSAGQQTPSTPRESRTVFVPNQDTRENPNGSPDLAVTILATGIMTEVDNKDTFFPLESIPHEKRAGIRFTVKNIGDKTMDDGWQFVAVLPLEEDASFEFESDAQDALKPGNSIEFTLGFDDIADTRNARISVEVLRNLGDRNESNDIDSTVVRVD